MARQAEGFDILGIPYLRTFHSFVERESRQKYPKRGYVVNMQHDALSRLARIDAAALACVLIAPEDHRPPLAVFARVTDSLVQRGTCPKALSSGSRDFPFVLLC